MGMIRRLLGRPEPKRCTSIADFLRQNPWPQPGEVELFDKHGTRYLVKADAVRPRMKYVAE